MNEWQSDHITENNTQSSQYIRLLHKIDDG